MRDNKIAGAKLKKGKLILLLSLLAIFWGMSFFGSNVALRHMNTFQILAVRWTIAMVIFLLLILTGKVKFHMDGRFPWLLATGMLQPCLYAIFETEGVRLTSTSECSIFIAAIPGTVLLTGILFFGKKSNYRIALGIILAFLGVVICTAFAPGFRVEAKATGYLMLIAAVLCSAFYTHCSGKAGETHDTMEVTAVIAILGGVLFNVISLATGNGFTGFTECIKYGDALIAVLFLGIFCSSVCYLIFNYVLARMNTAVVSNITASSATAIGVVSGVVLAGDPGGMYTVVGLALTIAGVWISGSRLEKTQR